jgi:mycofactocin system glycosyltransferase
VTDEGLPAGWSIELDPTARRTDDGHVLIGGSPFRILRLTDAGARWLDAAIGGEPLSNTRSSRALARRLADAGLANPRPSPGAGPTAGDVAVVVPVRDAPDGLRRTLASIGAVGEVVIVDDSSRDPRAVERAATGATLLRNTEAVGPGGARERGWRAATKPVIAFVDADVELTDGWLAPLLAHLGDPTVGAVAPRVSSYPGSAPPTLAAYEQARSPLDLGPLPGPVRPGTKVPYVPTATLVVRRQALESIDGFDAAMHVGEDVDLVWRLHASGWRVRFEPAVVVHHPSRPSFGAWIHQRIRYGTSAAALARRHGNAVAPLGISGWSALAWSAVLLGHPLVGVGIGAGTTAALVPKLHGLQHPAHEALQIAGKGNLWAGRYLADALRRPWWPVTLALGMRCRRCRPALVAATILPAAIEWRERRPPIDPIRFAILRLVDDLAYGAGVWAGCVHARSVHALLPSFSGPLPRPQSIEPATR